MSAPWFGGQQPQDPEKSGVLDPLLDEQGVQRTSDGSHGNQHDRFIASYDHQPHGDAAEVGEHNAPAKMSWAAWLLLAAAVRCHTFDRKAFKSSCTYEAVQLSSLTILSRAAAQLTVKSSAGAVFASLPEVGAITIAAWRMQLAAVIMLPVAIWQYQHASAGDPHVSFSVNGHCCDATGDWTIVLGQKQSVNEVLCADPDITRGLAQMCSRRRAPSSGGWWCRAYCWRCSGPPTHGRWATPACRTRCCSCQQRRCCWPAGTGSDGSRFPEVRAPLSISTRGPLHRCTSEVAAATLCIQQHLPGACTLTHACRSA